ncbi:four helix bundle protein [bacterium (Candidatus Torokbacteria) CG_4_10_14_0_2_um_filter_35_8]|nr:MAG: four helix bundle protein [bacterium (Candidatus Torokbacteria) CG_4_10_14_0_2_um_filter_35_8]
MEEDKYSLDSLKIWKGAHVLMLIIHKEIQKFPEEEKFNLVSQLRKAASSVANNIAEGYGRYYFKEKNHCFSIARGEVLEVISELCEARDKNYINKRLVNKLISKYSTLVKMINGYIGYYNKKAKKHSNKHPSS